MASAVQDNETVVEFFSFIAHPVMPFLRITALIKPSARAFLRGKTGQVSCRFSGRAGRGADPGMVSGNGAGCGR